MEKFLKRYFWTINLLTIAVCAYFAAKAVNSYVESYLRKDEGKPTPNAALVGETERSKHHEGLITPKSTFDPFQGKSMEAPKVTDEKAQTNLPPLPPPPTNPRDYTDKTECSQTSLPGTLIGTIASTDPYSSFALVQEGDNKVHLYEVGRELTGGARIAAVLRHKVFIVNNGRVECFLHGEAAKAAAKPKTEATAEGGDGIRKVSESEFIVANSEVQKALENMAVLSTQARIVPSFENGVANGFRFYSIQPGSLYTKIGLKNGDVVQRVNGQDMSSPEKALEVYTKLRTEKRITVDLLRNNAKFSLDYTIQ